MPTTVRQIEILPVATLRPYARNARRHSRKQIRQIAVSIRRFGFTNPVLIADDGRIVAGHDRVMAAKEIGMEEVPTLRLSHLTQDEVRAYVLADNKLALNAGWDAEMLAIEFQALMDVEFDLSLTGFSLAEVDQTFETVRQSSVETPDGLDVIPDVPEQAATRPGDIWFLGHHRLLCGDAREKADYTRLLGDERADLIFTDPPYNVAIDGNATGLGRQRHREFAMAAGEMSREAFAEFLTTTLSKAASVSRDGAIAFVCMDWRHIREMTQAGEAAFTEFKNLCVWNKTNGGMGSFYRSKHELIFVFKVGTAPHINNFGLGETGRYRTNVWDYPGVSSVGARRKEALAMHPTVKPVALVADAIKDCSRRGEIVLDIFGGSGSTLIAAESCGWQARLIEYDPLYCDVIIARWEKLTGKAATLAESGRWFENVADERLHRPTGLRPSPARSAGSVARGVATGRRRRAGLQMADTS